MLGPGEGLHSATLSEVGPGQTWGRHLQQGVVQGGARPAAAPAVGEEPGKVLCAGGQVRGGWVTRRLWGAPPAGGGLHGEVKGRRL